MSFQAVCAQVWLDVPADSHIKGEVDDIRRDVRFTVSCEHDEFELTFEPAALHRFVQLAQGLLAQEAAKLADEWEPANGADVAPADQANPE